MTQQHKIGSGFGFHSTADDVLAGIDLLGKLAVVTAATPASAWRRPAR